MTNTNTNTDVAIKEASTPVGDMLAKLKDSGVSIADLRELMEINREMDAISAIKAFNTDFAAMQGELPLIVKARKGHNYKYADLSDIIQQIRPCMAKHGFGFKFSVAQDGACVEVTCNILHADGHVESNTVRVPLSTPVSATGKEVLAPQQMIGSAITYGQRYALIAAVGLQIGNDDDDGIAAGNRLTPEQAGFLNDLLVDAGEQVRAWFVKKYGRPSNVLQSQYNSVVNEVQNFNNTPTKGI